MEDGVEVNIEVRQRLRWVVMSGSVLVTTGRSLILVIVTIERVADGVHAGRRGDGDRGCAVLLSLEVECE